MIDMHSKYDNMHKNGMFYALICINNHIIACIDFVLSISTKVLGVIGALDGVIFSLLAMFDLVVAASHKGGGF